MSMTDYPIVTITNDVIVSRRPDKMIHLGFNYVRPTTVWTRKNRKWKVKSDGCTFVPPNLNILLNVSLVNLKMIVPEASGGSTIVIAQCHNQKSLFYSQK